MGEIRYIISDTSKKVDVEPHVLRYWEEELNLAIPRNEMGHRYYRDEDIQLLKTVKILKDQGFQLKAIKMLLPDIGKIESLDPQSILLLREELNEKAEFENGEDNIETKSETSLMINHEKSETDVTKTNKMEQFREIMNDLIGNALKENNTAISDTVSVAVSNSVVKEVDYLLRLKEEREEERYKKFDETVRNLQKYRQEVALTKEDKPKKKSKFFRKNKNMKPI